MEALDQCEAWLAWAAGIIDGEGCISLDKSLCRPELRVVMTNEATLRHLEQILGGYVRTRLEKRPRCRPAWIWKASGKAEIKRIIELIRPWLVTKAKEADVMLGWLSKHPARPGVVRAAEEVIEGIEVYWKLRELKRG